MRNKIAYTFVCLSLMLLSGCNNVTDNDYYGGKITAANKSEKVNALANPYYTSVRKRLLSIVSDDVDKNGTSIKWIYIYNGIESEVRFFCYHADAKKAALDSISTIINLLPVCTNIAGSWLDTDQILKIAEDNGGREFRQRNTSRYGNTKYKIEARLLSPQRKYFLKYWFIKYYSTVDSTDILTFDINAETGSVTNY